MKVSACLGCTMTVLGDRERCPMCQADYDREQLPPPPLEADPPRSVVIVLLAALVGLEAITIVGCLAVLAFQSCLP